MKVVKKSIKFGKSLVEVEFSDLRGPNEPNGKVYPHSPGVYRYANIKMFGKQPVLFIMECYTPKGKGDVTTYEIVLSESGSRSLMLPESLTHLVDTRSQTPDQCWKTFQESGFAKGIAKFLAKN